MNTPHANTISTAEHAIGMLLALARRIPQAHVSVTNREWNRKAYQGVELYEKTLGVIGLGAVGREVAKRMRAFGMKVVAADPFVEPQIAARLGVDLVSKQELLSRSHAITIHVPLDSGTRGLIGAAELNAMRGGVLLVNCARGGIVDERALLAALEKDQVSAAGLDVFEDEPPADNPLLEHPRCVFTPHIGAATVEARIRVATDIAESVAEALTKGILRNVVNQPEQPR
jgi:D-3-phosphoglycerate dehydrogenase